MTTKYRVKADEKALAELVMGNSGRHPKPLPTSKRTHAILYKWADRGWWEYGVSARTGWVTPEGYEGLPTLEVAP